MKVLLSAAVILLVAIILGSTGQIQLSASMKMTLLKRTMMKPVFAWLISTIAPSMRAPQDGLAGWLAVNLMHKGGNDVRERRAMERLELKSTDVLVEIGAGHGFGLRAIGDIANENDAVEIPKRIVCVDISPKFRAMLQEVKKEVPYGDRVEIHDADCKDMPFLEDNSVTKSYAGNVVYFLDPLPEYLKELHRVLVPKTGTVSLGGSFDFVKKEGVFVNTEEGPIVEAMKEAGFDVTSTPVFAKEGDKNPLYTELKGIKKG